MASSFNSNKNPYAGDLLRLSNVPRSRFTPQERNFSASLLASKLYGLELAPPLSYWWPEHNHLLFQGSNRLVFVEVLFETESHKARLSELQHLVLWAASVLNDVHVIVLKVGISGVSELYNGKWDAELSVDSIDAQFQLSDAPALSDGPGSDSIPPRSDEEASSAYYGEAPADNGAGGGGDGDGLQQGGGGGGFRGGDEGSGGQAPGAGGVLELVNHPVLFTVDEEALDAILGAA